MISKGITTTESVIDSTTDSKIEIKVQQKTDRVQ